VKLLLDQNISHRLVKSIEQSFPGTQQIRKLGLENSSDKAIWEFAKREGFVIVTFDSDFYDLSLLHGHPPKLIWIRSGNLTTTNLEQILKRKQDQIESFISDNQLSCLEISE
jgi:predicted nuclease of predicted toxin-antitoxin system